MPVLADAALEEYDDVDKARLHSARRQSASPRDAPEARARSHSMWNSTLLPTTSLSEAVSHLTLPQLLERIRFCCRAKRSLDSERLKEKKKPKGIARMNSDAPRKKALTSGTPCAVSKRAREIFSNDDNGNRARAFINRRYFSFLAPLLPRASSPQASSIPLSFLKRAGNLLGVTSLVHRNASRVRFVARPLTFLPVFLKRKCLVAGTGRSVRDAITLVTFFFLVSAPSRRVPDVHAPFLARRRCMSLT